MELGADMELLAMDMDAPLANTRAHCVTHSSASASGTSAITATVGLRTRVVLDMDALRCATVVIERRASG